MYFRFSVDTIHRAIAVIALISTTPALAATLTKKLGKNKVSIDAGTSSGFTKGAAVCFYNRSSVKIGCGKVDSAQKSSAVVSVKQNVYQKLSVNFEGTLSPSNTPSPIPTTTRTSPTAVATSNKSPYFIRGLYLYHLGTPSSFQQLTFEPAEGESPTTLWKQEGAALPQVSGALELGIPIGTMSLVIGARYLGFQEFIGKGFYQRDTKDPYASNNMQAMAWGVSTDLQFWRSRFLSPSTLFSTSIGVDVESLTVTMKLQRLDDTKATPAATLATGKSSALVASARLGMDLNYFFGGLGVIFGAAARVPAYVNGPEFSGKLEDEPFASLNGRQADDLKASMAHGKGSVGIEIRAGAEYSF